MVSRRSVLSSIASFVTAASATAIAFAEEKVKFLNRGFFLRLFGDCATPEPRDGGCWSYSSGTVSLDVARAPELKAQSGAVRLEGRGLPNRVLVVHCEDGQFRAMKNACTHMGRRLDPVPGTATVQCCSIGRSTYDYQGRSLYGPGKSPATFYAVHPENGRLLISVS